MSNRIRKKEIISIKISPKHSYLEACKFVESRTPYVGVSYSSLLKQSLKSVRFITTQTITSFPRSKSTKTQSTSTQKEEFRDVSLGSKCYGTPLLERWLPSSKPVKIIYPANQAQKSSILSKMSSEPQTKTKAATSNKIK